MNKTILVCGAGGFIGTHLVNNLKAQGHTVIGVDIKHPFIIIGVPGSMQGLRDLGFQTFSEFWSEDYDTIESPSDRLVAIENILKEIASWSRDDILYFKRRVKPILEHNYNMFKEPGSVTVVNNIYEHITNNFNTDYSEYCDLERRCHFE